MPTAPLNMTTFLEDGKAYVFSFGPPLRVWWAEPRINVME